MPNVSIGLPVWNGERYLSEAIEAILAQTYADFELLIADNGSTDNSHEIAMGYAARDARVRVHRHERNLGAAANFNHVFHNTTGHYFRWAAYDDLIATEYLAQCVTALDADRSGAVLAYPKTMRIDETGQPIGVYDRAIRRGEASPASRLAAMIGPGDEAASMIHMCFPVFGLIRRDVLKHTSLIANMPRSDKLLLIELALRGPFIEIPQPLFLRREHDAGSVISAEKAKSQVDVERRLAAWFDPRKGRWYPATNSRLGAGYLKAALRTPMTLRERAAVLRVLANWGRRNGRIIGGEIKILLRERLGWRSASSGQSG